jgi:hypothetical protein
MIVVQTGCGLCNSLRVIFSYYAKALHENKKFVVIWRITPASPGHFLDYFKPIDGIEFVDAKDSKNYKIDYGGGQQHKDFPPNYDKLELLDNVVSILNDKRKMLGSYIAVHVRRTDHVKLAIEFNNFTQDEDFFKFIDERIKSRNLYIATDNEDTYNIFKDKYTNSIKLDKIDYNNTTNSLRQTSLLDSVVDLYMCIYAEDFMGSGTSSFSGFIKHNRYKNRILN